MSRIQADIRFLEASLSQLESYLLSDEVFWALQIKKTRDEPAFPRMTIGWILLVIQELSGATLPHDVDTRFWSANRSFESITFHWKSRYDFKKKEEFRIRLNLWKNFLEDYRKEAEYHFDRYSYEISRRVLLELLNQEPLELDQSQIDLLAMLDTYLKGTIKQGDFIWDAEFRNSYPEDRFWYLYGSIPGMRN